MMTVKLVLVVKNALANAEDVKDMGSIPGSGRSPGVGHGNLLQHSCLENNMGDRGAWWQQSIGLQRVGHDRSDLACTHGEKGGAISHQHIFVHFITYCKTIWGRYLSGFPDKEKRKKDRENPTPVHEFSYLLARVPELLSQYSIHICVAYSPLFTSLSHTHSSIRLFVVPP